MDSQGYNNNDKWVEERIAKLSPPPGWRPDADKAFEDVLKRAKPAALRPAVRLSMAGATIAVIGVVVVLLPWKALWTPKDGESTAATQLAAGPQQTTPETPETSKVTEPAPQSPATSQSDKAPVPTPEIRQQPIGRGPKKEPRIIAAAEPQRETIPAIAQTQGQQVPPSGVTPPVAIYKVQPQYTPEAREARVQGTVELSASVREDGTVKVESVVKGLGYGLDEAATAAVEQWKFVPGKKDGQPVAVMTNILINFGLK
jgi:TonB family protein